MIHRLVERRKKEKKNGHDTQTDGEEKKDRKRA